jgi:glycosyltransferase involved in cell wall biosynthesis
MPWSQAIFGPAARDADISLVFWMHAPTRGRHWLELWARLTPPDLTICNSRFTSTTLVDLYSASPFEVVYPPLPPPVAALSTAERVAVRAELDTPSTATVIVQASRMESWKGQEVLLEALGQLRDLPGWVCWVAGGPQRPQERRYMETLERAASTLGIGGRVRFLGERSDVLRILRAADIYCQPNTGPEPFGLALVEALGAGLPLISTAIGAATEIIDDSCGVLVEPGDIQALAGALRRLIEERGERTRLGAAGPDRARALCDPSRQLKRFAATLTRIARPEREPLNGTACTAAARAWIGRPS